LAALALVTALEAPHGLRHPATAYELLTVLGPTEEQGGSALDDLFRSLSSTHPARRAYGTAALSESRTRASIFTGTAAHLRLFGESGIGWLTAESEHDPADAGRKRMAIFLLLPDEGGARNALASLYISQMYSALGEVARNNSGRLPVPVWFLLDEFGNIPRIPGFDTKLTVAAGRGIRFVLALQDLAQLARYGEARQTITGNCDTWLFLRTSDVETAKVVSAKLGTFTVRTSSQSARLGGVGAQQTLSEAATGRPLLTPDEVLRWPTGRSLLIQSGEFPADLPLQDLSQWRAASAAFQPVPPPQARPAEPVPTWLPGSTEGPGTRARAPAGSTPAPTPDPTPALNPLTAGADPAGLLAPPEVPLPPDPDPSPPPAPERRGGRFGARSG
jgi:type IV secretion system protein VirD4